MPELRWTLLLLGALFIAVLAWSERRKARQSTRSSHDTSIGEAPVSRAQREPTIREPALRESLLTLPELRARDPGPPQDLPVVHVEDESLVGLRLDGQQIEEGLSRLDRAEGSDSPPLRSGAAWDASSAPDPSVPDLPVLEAADTSSEEAFNKEVFAPGTEPEEGASQSEMAPTPGAAPAAASAPALASSAAAVSSPGMASSPAAVLSPAVASYAAAASSLAAAASPAAVASTGAASSAQAAHPATSGTREGMAPPSPSSSSAPIVDWPPEEDRRIIALRLVSVSPERFSGRAIRTALVAEGFVFGKFSIFHKPDAQHRAVLSAASLSKPGMFDLETIDSQRFAGLNLFAVLSSSQPAREPFEMLLACARNLNERLEGGLQDDRGGPLTPSRIAALRESLGAAPAPLS